MPLMFPVYRLGGKPYLDGGAAETVPYPRAFEMGCDRAIVILTKPRSYVRKREKLPAGDRAAVPGVSQLLPDHDESGRSETTPAGRSSSAWRRRERCWCWPRRTCGA
ncbi:MAG: hypothetical protein ACLUJG_02690 [Lawsonibacter sp.]